MVLKVCDRCGCEIKPKNNNPSSIKFGWTDTNGTFTHKISIDAFDMCDHCMKQLVIFLGCDPDRIGVKGKLENSEVQRYKSELDAVLEKLKKAEEEGKKSAK